jgi:hypothetical protein
VVASQFGDCTDLGFSNAAGVFTAIADPLAMYQQHDPGGLGRVFMKDIFQNIKNKIHGGIVVIMEQNPIERRFLNLLLMIGCLTLIVEIVMSAGHCCNFWKKLFAM